MFYIICPYHRFIGFACHKTTCGDMVSCSASPSLLPLPLLATRSVLGHGARTRCRAKTSSVLVWTWTAVCCFACAWRWRRRRRAPAPGLRSTALAWQRVEELGGWEVWQRWTSTEFLTWLEGLPSPKHTNERRRHHVGTIPELACCWSCIWMDILLQHRRIQHPIRSFPPLDPSPVSRNVGRVLIFCLCLDELQPLQGSSCYPCSVANPKYGPLRSKQRSCLGKSGQYTAHFTPLRWLSRKIYSRTISFGGRKPRALSGASRVGQNPSSTLLFIGTPGDGSYFTVT